MHGRLSEFTLAQLLQFFALAERSGTVSVHTPDRRSRLLVEGDRIIGWGLPEFDVRETLTSCDLLPSFASDSIRNVRPRGDTPGLSFVIRNLIEPERWEAYAQRQLEQDIYPLLSEDEGEFEVEVLRCPPAPLRLSIPINSLILDGSRWESEMEAAKLDGFRLDSTWQRAAVDNYDAATRLSGPEWLVWASIAAPGRIADIAARLCIPDLMTIGAIRRLASLGFVERGV